MPIYSKRPSGPAGGSLSGSYPDPQVIDLSGSATGSFTGSFTGNFNGGIGDIKFTQGNPTGIYKTGIGTSSPYTRLHVYEGNRKINDVTRTNNGNDGYATVISQDGIDIAIGGNLNANAQTPPSGAYIQSFSAPFKLNAAGNNVYIGATGSANVGIGFGTANSALQAKLEVSGNVKATSFTGSFSGSISDSTYAQTASFLSSSTAGNVIDVSSSVAALRITQRGDGNVLIVEDATNPDSTPLVIDASGRVGIATTSPTYNLQVGNNNQTGNIKIGLVASASSQSEINFGRSGSAGTVDIDAYRGVIGYSHVSESLFIHQNATRALTITDTGSINIGPTNQTVAGVKLNVEGNVRATSFTGSFSGSLTGTASYASDSDKLDGYHSDSFVTTSSFNSYTSSLSTSLTSSAISASSLNVDYIDFNTSASAEPAFKTGRIHYGSASLSGDLEYDTDISGVTIKLGQQLVLRVRNNTAGTFNKGKLVKVSGSAGNADVLYIHTASWDNDLGSANTIGMVLENISAGANGYVLLNGLINGINTDGFSAGDMLYLSSSGDYTNIKPSIPYHEVRLGHVARVQTNNGSAFIRIQNGYELDELHDVYVPSASHGDLLVKSGSNNGSQWINTKQLSGSYGVTGSLYTVGNLSASSGITGSFSGSGANLDLFSTSGAAKGVVPGSNGSSSFFLKGDGTWSDIAASGYAYSATRVDDTKSGGEWLKLYSNKPNSYLYASGTLDITASSDLTIKTTANLNLGDASTNNTYIKGGKLIDISALTAENTKISISTPTGSSAGVTSSIDLTTKYINLTASQKIFASSSNLFLNDKFQVTSSNFYVNESSGTAGFIVRTAGLTQISSSNLYLDNKQFKLEVDRYNIITDISASSFTASVTAPILFITGASPLGFTISGYNIALNKTGIYDGAEVKVVNNVIQSGLPSYSSSIKVENQTIPSSSYKSFILLDNYWYPSA